MNGEQITATHWITYVLACSETLITAVIFHWLVLKYLLSQIQVVTWAEQQILIFNLKPATY